MILKKYIYIYKKILKNVMILVINANEKAQILICFKTFDKN